MIYAMHMFARLYSTGPKLLIIMCAMCMLLKLRIIKHCSMISGAGRQPAAVGPLTASGRSTCISFHATCSAMSGTLLRLALTHTHILSDAHTHKLRGID